MNEGGLSDKVMCDVFNDPVRVVAVRWRSNSTRSCPDAEVHACTSKLDDKLNNEGFLCERVFDGVAAYQRQIRTVRTAV
jgi:hypothetical protein